jgi:transposase
MSPTERIATLEAVVRQQRVGIARLLSASAQLRLWVHDLEARLATDSRTSSRPPSSDGRARKTRSLRKKSGKQSDGQLGYRGEALRQVTTPDTMVE